MSGNFLSSIIRRFSGGFILAFHDIAPERFIVQIESLSGFRPLPLSELVDRQKRAKPTRGLFAITVDDGVGDNVRSLACVLRSRQWPGTFYIPTDYVDTGEAMAFQWWTNMIRAISERQIPLDTMGKRYSPPAVRRLSRSFETLWRTKGPEAYMPMLNGMLDRLEQEHGLSRSQLRPPSPIAWEEVRALSSEGIIRFESHGTAHVAVSAMSSEELDVEMRQSQARIEANTGLPCRHFCYPFGSPQSIGMLASQVAQRYYDSAVTMNLGTVDGADPWLLPRIPVYSENSTNFAKLKIALKCVRPHSALWSNAGSPPQEAGSVGGLARFREIVRKSAP